MNRHLKVMVILALVSVNHNTFAERPGAPVVSLFNGQWVELRDLDPVSSQRDVRHLWLHRGTLLFGVSRLGGTSPYRDATTYSGLPIRLLAQKRNGDWHIKNIPDPNIVKSPPSFHLTRNVFCPGESNPFVLQGACLNGSDPIGEGYVFDLATVDSDEDGIPDRKNEKNYLQVKYELNERTINEIGGIDSFTFDIYSDDLDIYESTGVLFRLDRQHPLREVRFLDSEYQPCGSTDTSTIKKSTILKAYSEAEGKTEFKFWNWLTASIKAGISGSLSEVNENSVKIVSATTDATGTCQPVLDTR